MKEKELIKFTDGALINIEYEDDHIAGCPTCDYGSEYINEYTFVFKDNKKLEVKVNNMYRYCFSEGDMMRIILPNVDFIKTMSEKEFCDWLVSEIKKGSISEYEIPDNVYATYYGETTYIYDEDEED